MPITKNALLRYYTLDACFSNPNVAYTATDLVDVCNKMFDSREDQPCLISRATIMNDIRFMASDRGWEIKLIDYDPYPETRLPNGFTFRYTDIHFTINSYNLTFQELQEIYHATLILSNFTAIQNLKPLKQIEELCCKLAFTPPQNLVPYLGLDHNLALSGLENFLPLFKAIKNQQVLRIRYQEFNQNTEQFNFKPYYLKEYNQRWFVFGVRENINHIVKYRLDSIMSLAPENRVTLTDIPFDIYNYFEDIVGVTLMLDAPEEQTKNPSKPIQNSLITLKISPKSWPYIKSKPLHGSQKVVACHEDGSVIITLEVKVNYELYAVLFSYLDDIVVLGDELFKQSFRKKVEALYKLYR